MKIVNEDLDSYDRRQYILFLNSLICYFNSLFDDDFKLFPYESYYDDGCCGEND